MSINVYFIMEKIHERRKIIPNVYWVFFFSLLKYVYNIYRFPLSITLWSFPLLLKS